MYYKIHPFKCTIMSHITLCYGSLHIFASRRNQNFLKYDFMETQQPSQNEKKKNLIETLVKVGECHVLLAVEQNFYTCIKFQNGDFYFLPLICYLFNPMVYLKLEIKYMGGLFLNSTTNFNDCWSMAKKLPIPPPAFYNRKMTPKQLSSRRKYTEACLDTE